MFFVAFMVNDEMNIIFEKPNGEKATLPTGANHPADWVPIDIERNGVNLSEEEQSAQAMLAEIERELAQEGQGPGDWIKFFAKPVALLLGKDNCLSCEFRRVCINAGKELYRRYGRDEGKRKMKDLIKRSFFEEPEPLFRELKELLEN